ncbi:cation transporter [Sulfitobacter guttiformis]|uniref:Heavy-metal-associated domain-containing protein n=1 Tax=Sulfitobacter guttiformis TaxID=74349 RepID=A0A420DS11_9RHOB|nr:cation transporter [Sulfitobacter guttiformis]KIN74469.1 Copper-transporting P-type ATPase ActP [Sulfitobacter guttiformis KCTC 32187]RKE97066.1 heavy-metal-associated domain-containing protein [Sulfitobacter guttiformis]
MSDTFCIYVRNMSCDACAARAQKALDDVEGVEGASVTFTDKTAWFSVNSAKALKDAFAALEKAGYPGDLKEDEAASARRDAKENDATSLRRATLIATVLSLPVIVIETGSYFFPAMKAAIDNGIGIETSWQLQSVLSAIVLMGPGLRFFRRGITALLMLAPDVNTLIALAAGGAYLYSAAVLAAPDLFPDQLRAVYFGTACAVIVLTLARRWLRARSKSRAEAAVGN